jgi:hypothetical protein
MGKLAPKRRLPPGAVEISLGLPHPSSCLKHLGRGNRHDDRKSQTTSCHQNGRGCRLYTAVWEFATQAPDPRRRRQAPLPYSPDLNPIEQVSSPSSKRCCAKLPSEPSRQLRREARFTTLTTLSHDRHTRSIWFSQPPSPRGRRIGLIGPTRRVVPSTTRQKASAAYTPPRMSR